MEDLQRLVAIAEQAIRDAERIAEVDPARPQFHFRAPAQWMDDPNGIIFHNGLYHVMYSLNPHSAEHRAGMVYKTAVRVWDPESPDWTGGITVWGRATSADLLHWEHQPIAIYPAIDRGEHFIWFGCTVITDAGDPMAIYTAVGPNMRPEDTAQQWAAVGNPELDVWRSLPSNPLLTDAIHGEEIICEWRDPFVFKESGRTFMILGGRSVADEGGYAVVALYEALDPHYTSWAYRGVIFRHGDPAVPSAECPNLVKIDGRWLLILSPHGVVEYYVGQLDLETYKFVAETRGTVDYSRNFYATNILFDAKGRALMWGAVEGFSGTRGWNGCLSLPRRLSLSKSGTLLQAPAVELVALRRRRIAAEISAGAGTERILAAVESGGALEVLAEIELREETVFGLRLRSQEGDVEVRWDGACFGIAGLSVPSSRGGASVRLHMFVDRTVLDVFIDQETCATRIIPLIGNNAEISLYCDKGSVNFASVQIWELEANDLFSSSRSRAIAGTQ